LKSTESVAQRIAELQAEAAKSNEITVATICRELDEANAVAREKGQAAAMVNASVLRARLAGLLTDRVEVKTINNGHTLDDDSTSEDVAIAFAKHRGVTLSPEELKAFMGITQSWYSAMEEFLASCKAKQVEAVPAHSIERKRLGFAANKQATP
jgi:polysaccharide deacetylase 2 family uncharacterized protein YibQ